MSAAPSAFLTKDFVYSRAPRNVYWEMTIACDLSCQHCRANAIPHRDPAELTTDEAKAFIRGVKDLGSMLILTGGDPMKRSDLFELIDFARGIHVPTSITPSTTPTLTRDIVRRFKDAGIAAMGVSIDGSGPETHDAFRRVEGTFDHAWNALAWAREAGMPVQVNTTVTRTTLGDLRKLYERLAEGAAPPVKRWSLFLLVPTGRAAMEEMPSASEVEDLFSWVFDVGQHAPFHVGTVEAPHYRRYWIQRMLEAGQSPEQIMKQGKRMGLGVRDGNGVVFVSHKGEVYPAGFLPSPLLGNVKTDALPDIYRSSPELTVLRDMDRVRGKCGRCEFRWVCGGSRARAFGVTGNTMETDPSCAYEPPPTATGVSATV